MYFKSAAHTSLSGLIFRNKLSAFEGFYCIISQFLGALIAGLVCYALYHNDWEQIGYPEVNHSSSKYSAFVAEILQSFALVLTVLNVATTKANADNSYFGIAIGFVVLSGAITEGGKSGACYNPAVAMLTLLNGDKGDLWVFLIGPMIGGIMAGLLFPTLNPAEAEDAPLVHTKLTSLSSETQLSAAALLMEFIGTFFLTYTIALTANANVSGFVAVGAILTSMIYAGTCRCVTCGQGCCVCRQSKYSTCLKCSAVPSIASQWMPRTLASSPHTCLFFRWIHKRRPLQSLRHVRRVPTRSHSG